MKTIRDILDTLMINQEGIPAEEDYANQALKEISELLVECKQHIPSGVEEFKHTIKRGKSTCVVDRESYNLGQDDYEKNIKSIIGGKE